MDVGLSNSQIRLTITLASLPRRISRPQIDNICWVACRVIPQPPPLRRKRRVRSESTPRGPIDHLADTVRVLRLIGGGQSLKVNSCLMSLQPLYYVLEEMHSSYRRHCGRYRRGSLCWWFAEILTVFYNRLKKREPGNVKYSPVVNRF